MAGSRFDEMDQDPYRDDLVKSLLAEQGNLCAYCQQRIVVPIKIEHHCEQCICNGTNGVPDRRLDYTNLFAVCWGNENTTRKPICDNLKGKIASRPASRNQFLPMTINPRNEAHIASISYSNTGKIKSNLYDHELNDVLGLNEVILKGNRKALWLKLVSESTNKSGLDKVKLKRTLENLSGKPYKSEFPGMLDHMIKVFCR